MKEQRFKNQDIRFGIMSLRLPARPAGGRSATIFSLLNTQYCVLIYDFRLLTSDLRPPTSDLASRRFDYAQRPSFGLLTSDF